MLPGVELHSPEVVHSFVKGHDGLEDFLLSQNLRPGSTLDVAWQVWVLLWGKFLNIRGGCSACATLALVCRGDHRPALEPQLAAGISASFSMPVPPGGPTLWASFQHGACSYPGFLLLAA